MSTTPTLLHLYYPTYIPPPISTTIISTILFLPSTHYIPSELQPCPPSFSQPISHMLSFSSITELQPPCLFLLGCTPPPSPIPLLSFSQPIHMYFLTEVQPPCLVLLGCAAQVSEEAFAPYYASFVPGIKAIIRNAAAPELSILRGKAMECAGMILTLKIPSTYMSHTHPRHPFLYLVLLTFSYILS